MQFSSAVFALVALASSTLAQTPTANFDPILSPTQDQQLTAGSSFDIVWQASPAYPGTVTIGLLQGDDPTTLVPGAVVAAGVQNSATKYTWTVPTTNSFKTYGFTITYDADTTVFQYSFPFHVSGGSSSSSSATATGSSSSTGSASITSSANVTSSTAIANSTTSAPTTLKSLVVTANSTSNATTSASAQVTPTSNVTVGITVGPSKTTVAGSGSAATGASATGTGSASSTTQNAAAGLQVASGSLALVGGLIIAFAL